MSAYYTRRTFTKREQLLPTTNANGKLKPEPMMFGMTRKQLSLIVLVVQNSTLVLMMRYSRIVQKPGQPMYIASTAVFLAEVLKIIACLAVMYHQQRYWSKFVLVVRQEIFGKPGETAKMLIPSSLYALQNNLLYVALSNLEAATFQVTYQMKILSTAIFSVVLLGRSLTRAKWLALVLLMIGVTLVQSQSMASSSSAENSSNEESGVTEQSPLIGLIAVITSCISSGFAGCYFEKILKTSETSMWVRNIQLGLSGAFFSLVGMLMYDMQPLRQGGMLQGYDWLTWVVIANQALGGLLVAIVVKYADVILKSFATSISLILSSAISFYFFDFKLSLQFVVGACIVILATYNYSLPDKKISATSTTTATTKSQL